MNQFTMLALTEYQKNHIEKNNANYAHRLQEQPNIDTQSTMDEANWEILVANVSAFELAEKHTCSGE